MDTIPSSPFACYICGDKKIVNCSRCGNPACKKHAIPVGYTGWICERCLSK